jgi:amylosucrase
MYVDRHCGTLSQLAKEISYLRLMKVSMLHLMPTLYKTPPTDEDGGYAISDFRALNPAIGTMKDLRDLFSELRKAGISPIMDVTINHVAHDHAWAEAAKAGDPEKLAYFFAMDEAEKNEYEKHLDQMFPDIRAGNFTRNEEIGRFIWTSFMSSQWDLNYANPKVLAAMSDEMLFLLNQGAEVLRLDAAPMIWKEKGTACNNLPQVQSILGVFNTMTRIAAPGSLLISESIDQPAEIKRNLGPDKCQLAYNTITLSHFWDGLAHADASFMAETLKAHADVPQGSALLNMMRTHDDLPFHFDPGTAEALGIDLGQRHKNLAQFYLGGTSPARAVEFCGSRDPEKVFLAGTTGSLAGMEKALEAGDAQQVEAAIQRIRLLNGLLLGLPGVPMLNLTGGDDRGQTNDYSCMQDESLRKDTRWVHRVRRDIDFTSMEPLEVDAMSRVFNDTVELTRARTEMPAFGAEPMQMIDTGKTPVLAFARENEQQKVVVLANFSQHPQTVDPEHLRAHGMTDTVIDRIGPQNDQARKIAAGVELAPYQCMWLVPAGHDQPRSHNSEPTPH